MPNPRLLLPFLINGKMALPSSSGEQPTVSEVSSIACDTVEIEQAGRGYIEMCQKVLKREQNGALGIEEESEEETKIEEKEEDAGDKDKELEKKKVKKTKA